MKQYFNTICLVFAIIFYFLYTMMSSTLYFAGGTLCAIPGIVGLLKTNSLELKSFTIFVFLGSLMNMVMTSYGIGGSIIFLAVCGITYSCLRNLKVFSAITLLLCLGLIAFLYYQMIVVGTVNGDIFLDYGLSKNYPGSLLVMFNCVWATWKYLHYHKLPLLLPILSTIMAFFLDGRSSLICMILLSVFCFIFRGSGHYQKVIILVMVMAFLYLVIHYWGVIMDFYELTSLADKGFETSRTEIWKSYFDHLNISSLTFGLETENLPILKEKGGNPHNSFLSFHRRMGLIGVIALFYIIVKSFKVLIRRKQFTVLCIEVVLLVRMFFDGMLTTAEDFFILTLLFVPLCYKDKVFRIEEQIEAHSANWLEKLWDKVIFII